MYVFPLYAHFRTITLAHVQSSVAPQARSTRPTVLPTEAVYKLKYGRQAGGGHLRMRPPPTCRKQQAAGAYPKRRRARDVDVLPDCVDL